MHIVQKNILTSIFEIQLKITFLNHDIQSNYLNIANTAIAVYENWLSKANVSNTLVRYAVQSAENIPFNKKKSRILGNLLILTVYMLLFQRYFKS